MVAWASIGDAIAPLHRHQRRRIRDRAETRRQAMVDHRDLCGRYAGEAQQVVARGA
jgi:hypothetical protein